MAADSCSFLSARFSRFRQGGVTISTDQVVRLDVMLRIGAVSQDVTVKADVAMLTPML